MSTGAPEDASEGWPSGLDAIAAGVDVGLSGARVALLVNHTAVDARGRHAVEVFAAEGGCEVVTLLGPEHGLWGTHQDMEPVPPDARDPVFGLPITSLYGDARDSLSPRLEALAGVDAIVYDVRDVGARYYTYAATLALTMEAAAAAGVRVVVLDRPNPLGAKREGPRLRPGYESFCGLEAGLPIRHGLTVGALARWYQRRRAPGCALSVVPCAPNAAPRWLPPSPNMPTLATAQVYPGMCLLEGTTLSEGRGTAMPFLQVGAPGVDPLALCRRLRARPVQGVGFVPVRFRPAFGKHAGEICGGTYIQVFDGAALDAVDLGVYVLEALRHTAPTAFGWRTAPYEFVDDVLAIDLLWGSPRLRETLDHGADVGPLLREARADADRFDPTTG